MKHCHTLRLAEPWKHDAERQWQGSKGHIVRDSLYVKQPRKGKSIDTGHTFLVAWG